MSDETQLPGPSHGTAVHQSVQPPPGHVHVTVPVMQPSSPFWVDPSAATVTLTAPNAQPYHYVTMPSPASTSSPAPSGTPAPRPRKPYTTTKVREMWSAAEHERMLEGLRLYKRDWAKVTRYVGTRSAAQVRSHAQKYFDKVARDKTDEYVPRARPKRKSATPYPRKIREEIGPKHSQHTEAPSSPPMPIAIPVSAVHPAAAPGVLRRTAIAPPVHSPVQMVATAQSPIFSHMSSPYVAQAQQHTIAVQHTVPQHVYSPYMSICPAPSPNPERASVHASPGLHPSPLSYVSGHGYTSQSPHLAAQTISVPTQQVYSMLSPMTSGTYATGLGRSPSMTHTPVSVVAAQAVETCAPHHVPRHSHPGGPVDGCAKCSALQRYGNVLQELGDLNQAKDPQVGQAFSHPATAMRPWTTISTPTNELSNSDSPDKGTHRTPADKNRSDQHEQSKDRSGSSSGKRTTEGWSFHSHEDGKGPFVRREPASHRAHRARVIRARKARNRSGKERRAVHRGECEERSESDNSTRTKAQRQSENKESQRRPGGSTVPPYATTISKKRKQSGSGLKQSKDAQKRLTAEASTRKRYRASPKAEAMSRTEQRQQCQGSSAGNVPSNERESKAMRNEKLLSAAVANNVNRTVLSTGNSLSPKSDESESRANSPVVEAYTPREQKEIFDAVHSLQILAKTSSSPSASEDSGATCGDAQIKSG